MRALLRSHGKRATASRLAVLVTLHERAEPMSHEQIMEVLPAGLYDRASVWRVLADLADCGALRRMDLGDRVWRYELDDACRPVESDHPHFLCEDCGTVSCLPPLVIRAANGGLPGVLRDASYRIRVMGTCGKCLSV